VCVCVCVRLVGLVTALTALSLFLQTQMYIHTYTHIQTSCLFIHIYIYIYIYIYTHTHTRCFKYDRDYLCVKMSEFVPVIFEPPCISPHTSSYLLPIYSHSSIFSAIPLQIALIRLIHVLPLFLFPDFILARISLSEHPTSWRLSLHYPTSCKIINRH
jgi:hypothetical protein